VDERGVSLDSVDAATETRYLNASNRELCAHNEAQLSSDNPDPQDKKSPCQLLQFTFQELKSSTGNFRPDSILGEGGFGYVFKGWIEENGTAPAKPGSGITVAVKSLKPDGLQGHREWVVSRISAFLGLVDWCQKWWLDGGLEVRVWHYDNLPYCRLKLIFLDSFTILISLSLLVTASRMINGFLFMNLWREGVLKIIFLEVSFNNFIAFSLFSCCYWRSIFLFEKHPTKWLLDLHIFPSLDTRRTVLFFEIQFSLFFLPFFSPNYYG